MWEVVCLKVWVCPNSRCVFDNELKFGQSCPLCGAQAEEFDMGDVDRLLRQKWDFKKSVAQVRREEKLSRMVKFCPKCGSSNVNFLAFYRPSIWKCLDCGYEGAFMLEDSDLADRIRARRGEQDKKTG